MLQHPKEGLHMSDEVVIQVGKNSSYHVRGPAKIIDSQGKEYPITAGADIWLCRCGHSTTKPFCDGAGHRKSGFDSDPFAEDPE